MAEDNQNPEDHESAEKAFRVRFLAKETGITEAQARELIGIIGYDVASLLREARLLKKRNGDAR